MKRRLALKLHGWAYRLAPEIAWAVRRAIIEQLAAEHEQRQAMVDEAERMLAPHRKRAAHAARTN